MHHGPGLQELVKSTSPHPKDTGQGSEAEVSFHVLGQNPSVSLEVLLGTNHAPFLASTTSSAKWGQCRLSLAKLNEVLYDPQRQLNEQLLPSNSGHHLCAERGDRQETLRAPVSWSSEIKGWLES